MMNIEAVLLQRRCELGDAVVFVRVENLRDRDIVAAGFVDGRIHTRPHAVHGFVGQPEHPDVDCL